MIRCRLGFSAWIAALGVAVFVPALSADSVKSGLLESNVDYFRVSDVASNLPGQIQSAQSALSATNPPIGTVLDLRFADGDDLNAAREAADRFGRLKLPLAILVNLQTRGAAAALAKDLRLARAGLIFGNSTELKPDIVIAVNPADEQRYLTNAFAILAPPASPPGPTNDLLPFVDHTSEADLVRAKVKDGEDLNAAATDTAPPARKAPPAAFLIRDPVLARAVDLIKGLAVVRASHS